MKGERGETQVWMKPRMKNGHFDENSLLSGPVQESRLLLQLYRKIQQAVITPPPLLLLLAAFIPLPSLPVMIPICLLVHVVYLKMADTCGEKWEAVARDTAQRDVGATRYSQKHANAP